MNSFSQTDLINYLKYVIGGRSQRKFVETLSDIDENEGKLDPSVLNRILRGESEAREETLLKIGKIVLKRADIKVQDLWDEVYKNLDKINKESSPPLRIGTGFTCWSSYILNLINEKEGFPDQIEFVFCNEIIEDENGNKTELPYFVKNSDDIEQIRKFPERFSHKYVAEDLRDLLDEKKIDCAFLLRSTFEKMSFSKQTSPPLIHCRIAVGNGTHMYVITQVENAYFEENSSITKSAEKKENFENKIVELESIDDIISARNEFCKLVIDKRVNTAIIGNITVGKHFSSFIKDKTVMKSLTKVFHEKIIEVGDDTYDTYIEQVADSFISDSSTENEVFIVVAFEPLNNIVYHDLVKKIKGKDRRKTRKLIYQNFNLSKMVMDKSSYCLFSRPEVFDDVDKMDQIRHLLKAIETYVESMDKESLINQVSRSMADLYYPDTEKYNPVTKMMSMSNALKELEFVNYSLPFVDRVTDLLVANQVARSGKGVAGKLK